MTGEVNRHDRARPLRDLAGDILGIDVQGIGADVRVHDGCRGGGEREGGRDDLRTAWKLERIEGEMKRRGTRADRDRLAGADCLGEGVLELVSLRPHGEPPRTKRL